MSGVGRAFRSTVFLLWLVGALFSTSVALAVWVGYATWTAATAAANLAAATARHRQEIARLAAKARLRRIMVAVPLVGGGFAVWFERQAHAEWKAENPDGDTADYACFVAVSTAEVLDEVLQELPEAIRPAPQRVRGWLPRCASDEA